MALAPNLLLRCCARTFKRESELRCFGIKSNKIEELTSHVTRPTGSASRGSQSVVCLSLHRLQAPGLTLCVHRHSLNSSFHSHQPPLASSSSTASHSLTLGAGPLVVDQEGRQALGSYKVAGGLGKGHVEGIRRPLKMVRRFDRFCCPVCESVCLCVSRIPPTPRTCLFTVLNSPVRNVRRCVPPAPPVFLRPVFEPYRTDPVQ